MSDIEKGLDQFLDDMAAFEQRMKTGASEGVGLILKLEKILKELQDALDTFRGTPSDSNGKILKMKYETLYKKWISEWEFELTNRPKDKEQVNVSLRNVAKVLAENGLLKD